MAQYIDKAAVVAEIERRIEEVSQIRKASYEIGLFDAYKIIISFLDTLEVKEVDLEKEIETHLKECLDIKFPTTDIELIKKDVTYTAKKFFELGMTVSNKIQKKE